MTEQLKLADKIESWSPECKQPLTLIAHERRLVVAALRAIPAPDARVREALEKIIDLDTVISDGGKVHAHGACAQIAIEALSPQPGAVEAAIFKCNCPHEVRAGCSEPKCQHFDKRFAPKSPALDPATVECCAQAAMNAVPMFAMGQVDASEFCDFVQDEIVAAIRSLAKEPDQSVTRPER